MIHLLDNNNVKLAVIGAAKYLLKFGGQVLDAIKTGKTKPAFNWLDFFGNVGAFGSAPTLLGM